MKSFKNNLTPILIIVFGIFDNVYTDYSDEDENRIPKSKQYFRPVNTSWMANKCEQFDIPLSTYNLVNISNSTSDKKKLTKPKEIISIYGDGNCWYRCISIWMTNSEDYHELVRNKLYEFMYYNDQVKDFAGDMDEYFHNNPVYTLGTWATEVEIFATALLLKTCIYIYSNSNETWQYFGKKGFNQKGKFKNENCLYIRNDNNLHYDVVREVQ